ETFTVASADGTSKPAAVTVTITGTNDAAVISTDAKAITGANVWTTVRGAISMPAADGGKASFVAQGATAGTYGTFTIDAAGNWGDTMSSPHALPTRRSSDLETFTVASADGTSKPAAVTVTITGTNDAAVISTDAKAITESNVAQAVNGTLTVKIGRAHDWTPVTVTTRMYYGTFAINAAGSCTYSISSAHAQISALSLHDALPILASADGTSKPAAVTVTITGTNDAAVISTDAKAITESNVAQAVNGTLTV